MNSYDLAISRGLAWRRRAEKAEQLLRGMLIDPVATLDEPDKDGEVILKYRREVEAYFAALDSEENQ
jgi:hypothetical protein